MPTDKYTDEYALFLRRNLDVHDMVHIVMDFERFLVRATYLLLYPAADLPRIGNGVLYIRGF